MNRKLAILFAFILMMTTSAMVFSAEPQWRATYWNNIRQEGHPVLERNEYTVSYSWREGAPGPGVKPDRFSARWQRTFPNSEPGRYYFKVNVDDGVRLWVNGNLLINDWNEHALVEHHRHFDHAGGPINIRIDYVEVEGLATMILDWGKVQIGPSAPTQPQPHQPQPQPPAPYGTARIQHAYHLNLRSGPGMAYHTLGVMSHGDHVELTGFRYGEWIQIKHGQLGEGWTKQYYLYTDANLNGLQTMDSPPANQPPASQAHAPQQPAAQGNQAQQPPQNIARITNANVLNLREGPSTNTRSVATAERGTVVELTGFRTADTGWVQIRHPNGAVGWVKPRYLDTNANLAALTVWDGQSAPPDASVGLPQPSREATVARAAYVNVRTGPGMGYAVATQLANGTQVQLSGFRNVDATWVMIEDGGGMRGWIHTNFLDTQFPLYNLTVGGY